MKLTTLWLNFVFCVASSKLNYEIGTKECTEYVCECQPGFTGAACNTCQDGHFGPYCHPIKDCCNEVEYSALLFRSNLPKDKPSEGVVRKRRDFVYQRKCEYMDELCEIGNIILQLYDEIDMVPYTDDLGPFMADINHKIADILNLKLKIDDLIPYNSGINGDHDNFQKEIQHSLENVVFNLTKIDTLVNGVWEEYAKLRTMLENMQHLWLKKSIAESKANTVNEATDTLKQNVTDDLSKFLDSVDMDSITNLKSDLLGNLTNMHNNISAEFYEPCEPNAKCVPLFNESFAEEYAAKLKEIVEKSQSRLPHGYPYILSWFDEAGLMQHKIQVLTNKILQTFEDIEDAVNVINMDSLKVTKISTSANALAENVVDVKKLILYVDVLNQMSSEPSPEDKEKVMELLAELDKILESKKNFDEIVDRFDESTIDEDNLVTDPTILEAKFEKLSTSAESVTDEIKKIYTILNQTEINISDFESEITEISTKLTHLTGLLDSHENVDVEELKRNAEKARQTADEAVKEEEDLMKIVDTISEIQDSITRKKRGSNGKNGSKKNKKSEGHSLQITRIQKLLKDTEELQNDILEYRNSSSEDSFKTYLENITGAQPVVDKFNKNIEELCGTRNECSPNDSIETIETVIKAEIKELHERAKSASTAIFSCIGDQQWKSNYFAKEKPTN